MKLNDSSLTSIYLVVRNSCPLCVEMEDDFKILKQKYNDIDFHVLNLDLGENMSKHFGGIITPSVFIDDSLWRTGKIDKQYFIEKLNSLSGLHSRNKIM
ncbi:MAG: hypothetical protein HOF04_04235 [Candidatus Marinimicrobia bacterium]|nr:hypothetical protein [Candidatus Neomarinimicrobiota bacterium]MBT7871579.1 hypothetical protein [Candidatus Neomarinimicrobiota bacterium]